LSVQSQLRAVVLRECTKAHDPHGENDAADDETGNSHSFSGGGGCEPDIANTVYINVEHGRASSRQTRSRRYVKRPIASRILSIILVAPGMGVNRIVL